MKKKFLVVRVLEIEAESDLKAAEEAWTMEGNEYMNLTVHPLNKVTRAAADALLLGGVEVTQ